MLYVLVIFLIIVTFFLRKKESQKFNSYVAPSTEKPSIEYAKIITTSFKDFSEKFRFQFLKKMEEVVDIRYKSFENQVSMSKSMSLYSKHLSSIDGHLFSKYSDLINDLLDTNDRNIKTNKEILKISLNEYFLRIKFFIFGSFQEGSDLVKKKLFIKEKIDSLLSDQKNNLSTIYRENENILKNIFDIEGDILKNLQISTSEIEGLKKDTEDNAYFLKQGCTERIKSSSLMFDRLFSGYLEGILIKIESQKDLISNKIESGDFSEVVVGLEKELVLFEEGMYKFVDDLFN